MLRLESVCKRYGEREVLRDVSLEAKPGTLTLVTGANGTGKSTLLRIMAGLCLPDSGQVERNCGNAGVGYLGHDTFIYPHLTALENLAFWQKLHKKTSDEKALLDALGSLGLTALADEKAGTFSRGTAQRLSLARVFLQAPSLILLDEPLSGLDTSSAAKVREGLEELKRKGTALVWVSHSPLEDARDAQALLLLLPGGRHKRFLPEAFGDLEAILTAGDAPC